METATRQKVKVAIAALEAIVMNPDDQLDTEAQDRQVQNKADSEREKKPKELNMQLEDERRLTDKYKEQENKVR